MINILAQSRDDDPVWGSDGAEVDVIPCSAEGSHEACGDGAVSRARQSVPPHVISCRRLRDGAGSIGAALGVCRRMTLTLPAHGRQASGLPATAVYLPLIPRVTGSMDVWSNGRAMGREHP